MGRQRSQVQRQLQVQHVIREQVVPQQLHVLDTRGAGRETNECSNQLAER